MHAVGRVNVGRRPKQESIDDAEHRCVRPDAESQGEHDGRRESGLAAKTAHGVPHVVPEERGHGVS